MVKWRVLCCEKRGVHWISRFGGGNIIFSAGIHYPHGHHKLYKTRRQVETNCFLTNTAKMIWNQLFFFFSNCIYSTLELIHCRTDNCTDYRNNSLDNSTNGRIRKETKSTLFYIFERLSLVPMLHLEMQK